jgi:hypothetical protein
MDQKLIEFARDQMQLGYTQYRSERDNSYKVRGWCITIVAALLTLQSSGKLSGPWLLKGAILAVPVIMFWLLDVFYMMLAGSSMEHANNMSKIVLGIDHPSNRQLAANTLSHCFPRNRREKFRRYARGFVAESVTLFYGILFGTISAVSYLIG